MKYLLLILICFKAHALTNVHLQMKPNAEYMSFFLTPYVEWHSKTFNSHFFKNDFIRRAFKKIDHWKAPDYKEFDQILLGEKIIDDKKIYSYRLYIHPELRDEIPGGKAVFIEWDDSGKLCYLIPIKAEDIPWDFVPKRTESKYFKHDCNGKTEAVTMTSLTLSTWKNPFHGQAPDEIRTYTKEGLDRIFYFVYFTHAAIIPKKHLPYINQNGENALLPFDKYTVDKNGELTIYYP